MNALLLKILLILLVFSGLLIYGGKYLVFLYTHKKDTSAPTPSPTMFASHKREETYFLTLNKAQKEQLRKIIRTNAEAELAYGDIEAAAEEAMKDDPNPITKIQSSGILKGDKRKTASLESVKDAEKVYALAFAYTVSEEDRFAQKAKEFVLAWAKENKASEDPIDERLLQPMFLGYDLIKMGFSDEEKALVDRWMIESAHTLIDNINPSKIATSNRNNHQSHLLATVAMIGFSTNDVELIEYVTEGYKKHIAVNLRADGSSFDFHQRDALYYHVFTLEPLLTVARIADMNRINLFDYQTSSVASRAASLEKSVVFLIPYATGKKKHKEWVRSTAPFDKKREEAGDEEFQPGVLFNPTRAYKALQLYYYFNPDILPTVLKLSEVEAEKYPDFMMVYLDALR